MARCGQIVIVGGGPSGITTALSLQRAAPELAERIVVLEKGVYPREKYCAGAIGGRGDAILERLDAVPNVPSAHVDGISLCAVDGEQAVKVGAIGRVIRRIEFDHALAKIAMKRNIRVLDGTRVDALKREGRTVAVETSKGTFHADVVVGCDGVGSIVRKTMGLGAGKLRAQVLEVDTEPVGDTPADRDRGLLHFDAADRRLAGYYWDFPTIVGGKEMICRGIYQLRKSDDDPEIRDLFAERLRDMGIDLAKCKNKRFAERGFERAECVASGSMMLVGEAAGIDPVTGEGIAQAIEYGAMAGEFLAEAIATQRPIEAWSETMKSSRLARDLSIRTFLADYFYGPARPRVERFLVDNPNALHLGCQHFSAKKLDRLKLVEIVLRAGALLAGEKVREALTSADGEDASSTTTTSSSGGEPSEPQEPPRRSSPSPSSPSPSRGRG